MIWMAVAEEMTSSDIENSSYFMPTLPLPISPLFTRARVPPAACHASATPYAF